MSKRQQTLAQQIVVGIIVSVVGGLLLGWIRDRERQW